MCKRNMYKSASLAIAIATWSLGGCARDADDLTDPDVQDSGDITGGIQVPESTSGDPGLADSIAESIAATEAEDGFESGEFESEEAGIGVFEIDELEINNSTHYTALSDPGPYYDVVRYQTCNGGWPGTRTCTFDYTTSRDIRSGSVAIRKLTWFDSGSVQSLSAVQLSSRKVRYSATVSEGDVFNPGKHTSSFSISWQEYRGAPGGWDYCSPDARCGAMEGDCDSNAECQPGLACVHNVGSWLHWDPEVDVCLPVSE